MSLVSKAVITVIFFSLVVTLIALLPSTTDYPLPTGVNQGITIIVGYYYAWANVFTFLNVLFLFFVLSIFIDIYMWIARVVLWIIGFVSRFVG